jgi:hypothetical protein
MNKEPVSRLERNMPRITINGKTYENPDDVPPEAWEAYQKALEILHDENHNGIPDFLEGKPLKGITDMQSTMVLPMPVLTNCRLPHG